MFAVLRGRGAGIFNLPFTVMLWTIIRLIIVVSLVFITGKFGLSREFTFPAAAVGLAFSLFPVLDHIALGYSAKISMKPLILWGKRFGNLVPVKLRSGGVRFMPK